MTRKKILEVSNKILLEKGYDKTTTSEIACQANIAEGTIYNYFSSKAEIFFELFSSNIIEIDKDFIYDEKVSKSNFIELTYELVKSSFSKIKYLDKRLIKESFAVLYQDKNKKFVLLSLFKELDDKIVDTLFKFFEKAFNEGYLFEKNTKLLSQTVYSILMSQLSMYTLIEEISFEEMMNTINRQLDILLKDKIVQLDIEKI